MTNKLILEDLTSLQNDTTVMNVINDNNDAIVAAMDNTLSLDGSSPNSMDANFDMNGFQILNLPNPNSPLSPLRLQDLTEFLGQGTVQTIPQGGTTGQVLAKDSNVDYDVNWTNSVTSVGLSMPTDFTITNPVITTAGTIGVSWANGTTGSGPIVEASSPVLTGTPTAPTADVNTNTQQIATTQFVVQQASVDLPVMDSTAASGSSLKYAREDHVHPSDTTKAPLASPAFTGTPTAPTQSTGDNSTKIATTAFVQANATSAGVSSIDGTTGAITTGSGVTSSAGVIKLANNSAISTSVFATASTSSTTEVMAGAGSSFKITPLYSTRVKVDIVGRISQNTGTQTGSYSLRYGTGTPPTTNTAATGTLAISGINVTPNTSVSNSWTLPLTLSTIVQGLTPGTQYWFDVGYFASANTVTVSNLNFSAMEF